MLMSKWIRRTRDWAEFRRKLVLRGIDWDDVEDENELDGSEEDDGDDYVSDEEGYGGAVASMDGAGPLSSWGWRTSFDSWAVLA